MFKEFKEFAFKGNLIDMAVGIMIGGAFATVVKSLVDNIFMPPLGMLLSNVDFKKLVITLNDAVPAKDGAEAIPAVTLNYGQFITDFISFLLMALAIFILIKKVLSIVNRKPKEPEPAPPAPSNEELLLTEIRDLLAKKP
jgi:large conductance mechanosensitive channel